MWLALSQAVHVRYFQSIRARTASAARRSDRSSRNWSRVTSARRHGASPGWPRLGKRSAKSSSRKTAPSSSRSFRSGSPLRKAARATRAVASGTGSMGLGLRDMVDLSGGSAADSHDIGPPAGPARFRQQYPNVFANISLSQVNTLFEGKLPDPTFVASAFVRWWTVYLPDGSESAQQSGSGFEQNAIGVDNVARINFVLFVE